MISNPTPQDKRSEELSAYDRALCESMSLDQLNLYNAKVGGALIWHMAATPELTEMLRDVMKRMAEEVLR